MWASSLRTLTLFQLTAFIPFVLADGDNVPFSNLLTIGQGYNTFLNKGAKHDAVEIKSAKVKRNANRPHVRAVEPGQVTTFEFTPPSGNLTGLNIASYLESPSPDVFDQVLADLETTENPFDKLQKLKSVGDEGGSTSQCNGDLRSETKLTTSFESYLKSLGISASATISGYGQSAAVSGNYLDQAKFSKSTLTYVAIMDVTKQLDVRDGFKFNTHLYHNGTFLRDFGDRWIRGFTAGGRMIARISITSKNKSSKNEIQAKAEAALSFWGMTGELSSSVKKSMEELNKDAEVDVSLFYQGDLRTIMSKEGAEGSIPSNSAQDALTQAKRWADAFLKNACQHDYKYGALLDSYETIPNFPTEQDVVDYSIPKFVSYMVLGRLVKVTEMSRLLANAHELSDDLKAEIAMAEIDMIEACKKWVTTIAKDQLQVKSTAKALIDKLQKEFMDKYKSYVPDPNPNPNPNPPCTSIPCYGEMLRLQGSLGRLHSACQSGQYATDKLVTSARAYMKEQTCYEVKEQNWVAMAPAVYKPVCKCVLGA
ncbi:hypothetical protein XA68_10312 [Ophiocordyceps unilateralis]|uniref:MACPF domain-containing protein n=1 Tax=Ophiocordyceps unilateralis TaxID=268505 RepID=A0A2A9PHH7_OPHUN|nr:hypothetical protein XA68_10312 [Ophiocordyceps unilateralis]